MARRDAATPCGNDHHACVETSVVIPVRNGARFIAEAIESVLSQIGPDDELLVVDDASTDATAAIVAAIRDPRVRMLKGEGRGVSTARNLGLAAARGAFVAFLDHDDRWPDGRHAALLGLLRADPDAGAAFGRLRLRMEADAADWTAPALDGSHIVTHVGTALYRHAAIAGIGGFSEDMAVGEDVELHQRLLEAGLVSHLHDGASLIYRRHGANMTNDRDAVRRSLFDIARRQLARRKAAAPG